MQKRTFDIIPAIDLKGGRCVRLRQGVAGDETVYAEDPLSVARKWRDQGAAWLHVVDLDGAFAGRPVHTDVIRKIVNGLDIPVEVGGGLREDEHLRELIDAGVSRVILGTRACESPDELSRLVDVFGSKLAVGIDARNGFIQVKGWTETTGTRAVELADRLNSAGVATLIYTDTALDGMMKGPNIEGTALMCRAFTGSVIASGGITTKDDVANLRAVNEANLAGCIVGKALYEGSVTLPELAAIE